MHNNLVSVKSGDVEAMGYDEDSETFDVKFKSGKIWRYHRVSSLVGNACMSSDTPSFYFKRYIKPHYRSEPIS